MSIITENDFGSYFELYKPRGGSKIQGYIDIKEPYYIRLLFGSELAAEITEELGENPIPERTQKLLDLGLKNYLVAFIWSDFERDSGAKNSGLGLKSNDSEASQNADMIAYIQSRHNEGVRIANEIQTYICRNIQDYKGYEPTVITLSYF